MFFFLLSLIIALKLLTTCWVERKKWVLFYKLKNDLPSYPIVGHIPLLVGTNEDRMTTFQLLGRQAIKHGGISKAWGLSTFFVVIADAEIAETIFRGCLEKSELLNLVKNLIGNGSIFAPVPQWRPRRKVLTPAFAPKHLNFFVTIFDKNARTMSGQLAAQVGKGSFSVWKYLAAYSMDSVCESTLNVKVDALRNPNQPFLHAFDEYCKMVGKRLCEPWNYNETVYRALNWKITEHIKVMHDFVDEIVQAKRKSEAIRKENQIDPNLNDLEDHRNTLLDVLVNATFATEGYTDLEIREELLTIMLAGSDTSATGSGFLLLILAMYPDIQDKVYEELQDIYGSSLRSVTPEDLTKLKYMNLVIKETLRLYPSVPTIVRKTHEDVTLSNGLLLPKNTDIILNLWAINRNPRYWGETAEEFDPDRFQKPLPHPAALASFSYGPRNCIGYQYAFMSMKTVLATVLRRFRVVPARPADGTKLRVSFDVMMKDVHDFHIKLEERTPKANC